MILDKNKPFYYDLLSLLLGLGVIGAIFLLEIQFDIKYHIVYLIKYIQSGTIPVPPLYYLSIYTLSGFSLDIQTLGYTAILLLSFSILFKYKVTTIIINYLGNGTISRNKIYIFSFFLLIFMSVISEKNLYLGKPSPNVWHNSTVIFLMPFALLLFYYSAKLIKEGMKTSCCYTILALVLINALIKPSFLFVYISLPVLYCIYYGFNKTFWFFVSCSLFALLLIASETAYIYFSSKDPFSFVASQEKNEVILAPFEVWSYYTKNIPISFLSSIVFPAAFLILNPRSLKENFFLTLTWVFFIGAILIFILFAESGYRKFHGNFSWQIIPSMYLLFTVTLTSYLAALPKSQGSLFVEFKKLDRSNKLLLFLFFLHVISGIAYLIKLLYFKNFW